MNLKMPTHYILAGDDGHTPVEEPDLHAWEVWMANTKNITVKRETTGLVFVATVFLGVDHNFRRWAYDRLVQSLPGAMEKEFPDQATAVKFLDEAFGEPSKEPVLFQTVVLTTDVNTGDIEGGPVGRCSTWEQAMTQHLVTVAKVTQAVLC